MKPALGIALMLASMIAAPLPACSPAAPAQEAVTLALPTTPAATGATSDGPSATRPPLLRCDLGGAPTQPASRPERNPAVAGQMTEEAARAARTFRAIAAHRNHIKHRETLLWLTKLASDHPELVDAADFQGYTGDDIAMFNSSAQHTAYDALLFFLGRARMQSRELGEAARWLGAVPAGSRYASEARECLGVVQKAH